MKSMAWSSHSYSNWESKMTIHRPLTTRIQWVLAGRILISALWSVTIGRNTSNLSVKSQISRRPTVRVTSVDRFTNPSPTLAIIYYIYSSDANKHSWRIAATSARLWGVKCPILHREGYNRATALLICSRLSMLSSRTRSSSRDWARWHEALENAKAPRKSVSKSYKIICRLPAQMKTWLVSRLSDGASSRVKKHMH